MLVEILEEACTHSFPHCRHIPTKDIYRFSPLTFSHVSTHFRHLVLSTKTIWTCIHITPKIAGPRATKLAELFLSRSADLPITITVVSDMENPTLPEPDPPDRPTWRLLASQVHRWESAALHYFHNEGFATIFNALENTPLPSLRLLSISVHPRDLLTRLASQKFKLTAPALTELRLHIALPSVESFAATGRNLTYLLLGDLKTESHYLKSFLQNCEALTTLILGPIFRLIDVGIPISPLHLPRLQHLALTDLWDHSWSTTLLKDLVAPNLSDLAVQWDFIAYVWRHSVSFSTVRRLRVLLDRQSSIYSPHGLVMSSQFLQAFCALEELYLGSYVADGILKAATTCQDVQVVLQTERLRLYGRF